MLELLFLLLGLVLLVKGSDYFVEASARIAKRLGVSNVIIGLTFVAVGTSLPELASSIAAAIRDSSGLIVGNVVGSNIANIGLIVGFSAALAPLLTSQRIYHRDSYILIFSVILLFVFSYDSIVTRLEAGALVGVYIAYTFFLIKTHSKTVRGHKFRHFLDYLFGFGYLTTIRSRLITKAKKKTTKNKKVLSLFKAGIAVDVLISLASIAAILFGARYLIDGAIWLGSIFNLPENLIGLSVVAIGTSLPELSVSINAARKGFGGMVIGNVVGSNIANILLVFGLSAVLRPVAVSEISQIYTIPIMGFFSVLLVYFIRSGKIKRSWGVLSLIFYAAFLAFVFFQGLA